MNKRASMGLIASAGFLAFATPACTSLLGGIDFEGAGGAGGSTTSTTSAGGATCDDAGCDTHATCDDSSGKPVCTCGSGFKGNGMQCADVNECDDPTLCKGDTTCENTPGSYACTCPPGDYEHPAGSGKCVIDPCKPESCNTLGGACHNDTGVAVCACNPGWFGPTCADCIRFVDPDAAGASNGFTWTDAFKSVQPAIETAHAAVTSGAPTCSVWVKKGTYYIYASGPSDTIKLYTSVGLYGGFAGGETDRSDAKPTDNPTILSGKKSAGSGVATYHVVTIADATGVTVDGFTIQDGKATGMDDDSVGGGILVGRFQASGSGTISRCEIAGNTASFGAGLSWRDNGAGLTLGVSGCTFHDNAAVKNGGGMSCSDGCTITQSVFRANTAENGGGALLGGAPTLTDCSFVNNVTSGDAGGVFALNVNAGSKLMNLIFDGNRTNGIGGGIYTSGGAVTISNGLFVGNAASAGGAIADDSPSGVSCVNCTITGNLGTAEGDGIRWYNSNAVGAPKLSNTILWGNPSLVAEVGDDVYPKDWAAIAASHSDVGGYAGVDVSSFDANPLFVSMPAFYDRTMAVSANLNSVLVASIAGYAMGDVLEIGGDGTARTVTGLAAGTVSFSPALAAAAAKGTQIRDWDLALGPQNPHLKAGSPCINTGTAAGTPPKDLENNDRGQQPDLGVYEHP